MKKFFAFQLFFLLSFSLFCQNRQRILSPVEGNFANKQFLAIELNPGEEAFYSFSSSGEASDPLEYGFAYDSPVLIDLNGKIDLKIAIFPKSPDFKDSKDSTENGSENFYDSFQETDSKNNFHENSELSNTDGPQFTDLPLLGDSRPETVERFEIKYSVQESQNPSDEKSENSVFIKKILKNEMILCSGALPLEIPSGLRFCLGNGEKTFMNGTVLSVLSLIHI